MGKKKVFISVGEVSGDNYGAELVKRLPQFEWIGITGHKMEKAGVKSIENIKNISVVGLSEAIPKYFNIKRTFKNSVKTLKTGIDTVIVIDFPGYNLKLIKEAKKLGLKTVYFIAPQVWAWGKSRIKDIVKYTDLLITILPFEKKIYEPYISKDFQVEFFGHPLLDIIKTEETDLSFRKKLNIPLNVDIFGLLPGSRESEVKIHLPILLKTATFIQKVFPNIYFVIPTTPNIESLVVKYSQNFRNVNLRIITEKTFKYPSYEVMDKSKFSLITSGTATLEAGIVGNPFALIYKVSPFTYFIGKLLVSVDYLGLPNLIAEREIIKEFLQNECEPVKLANYSINTLLDRDSYLKIKNELLNIKSKLGEKGALDKIADRIDRFVSTN
ncbi:MAG: lipid-A-disaccharide synthase [Persephonella sp.]|nr:MAG: lipid-A-disaccharide synthase [Persephonella sp.]